MIKLYIICWRTVPRHTRLCSRVRFHISKSRISKAFH